MERLVQEYGPVVTLEAGSTTRIMIGRRQAAMELMLKENAALADRPAYVAAGDIVSGGMRLLLLGMGKLVGSNDYNAIAAAGQEIQEWAQGASDQIVTLVSEVRYLLIDPQGAPHLYCLRIAHARERRGYPAPD